MKYYIIAGERSGDLHGSNLIKGIRKYDSDAQIRAWAERALMTIEKIIKLIFFFQRA